MYELSHPWYLIAFFIPFVIIFLLPGVPVDYKMALKVPFYHLFLEKQQEKMQFNQFVWLKHWLCIWSLLVFALAGPRWVGLPARLSFDTHHVMVVLDISGSMALEDMPSAHGMTARWNVVKQTALSFIQKRTSDKIGLILFGERAYIFAPLTHDMMTLKERINDGSVGLAGQATAIGDAIGLGIKHLQSTPKKGRVMILLTDGVANAGVLSNTKAAKFAAEEGIKIYVIGLGPKTEGKGLSGLFWQMQHANDLDEESLRKIAQITHGKYFLASDEKGLQQIYQAIDQLEPVKQERFDLRPQHQYFYWPLALALLWILTLFLHQIYRDWRRR